VVRGLAIAALLAATAVDRADARNPHCSGGILYVTQAMRDKDKGDTESYERQMRKAVHELEQGVAEDPADAGRRAISPGPTPGWTAAVPPARRSPPRSRA
jgi:hypothetical protein